MTLKDHSLKSNSQNPTGVDRLELVLKQIVSMDESELAAIRNVIDGIQPLDLEKLDLNAELALQYRQAKQLLAEVQKDSTVPANQKAQVFNSVRAQLSDIVKQQESVWSMERLKTFEVAFLKAANALTPDARDLFFDLYMKHLSGSVMAGVPIADIGADAAPAQASTAPRKAAIIETVHQEGQ